MKYKALFTKYTLNWGKTPKHYSTHGAARYIVGHVLIIQKSSLSPAAFGYPEKKLSRGKPLTYYY